VYPWLRLMGAGFSLIGAPKVELLTTTRIMLRVWPNDLDLNLHVNNGRYLSLADIGRMHWFSLTGLLRVARRQGAFPVVGNAIAKFRRDLKVFESVEIHTRLVGWDRRWGYIEHRFVRRGRVIGVVLIRGVFTGPDGALDPALLLAAVGHSGPSPDLPEWVSRFRDSSESLSQSLRDEERAGGIA
jgi:acyl-CoA thioesterase FadM